MGTAIGYRRIVACLDAMMMKTPRRGQVPLVPLDGEREVQSF